MKAKEIIEVDGMAVNGCVDMHELITKTGWWKLSWESTGTPDITELNDVDLEHIADCIKSGLTEGQIIQEEI